MSTPLPDVLTLADFRRWLEGKSPTDTVGYPGNSCSCPLATYLRTSGMAKAEVGVETYWQVGRESAPLPDWAHEFVSMMDGRAARLGLTHITAADALQAIEDATDELAEQLTPHEEETR